MYFLHVFKYLEKGKINWNSGLNKEMHVILENLIINLIVIIDIIIMWSC